MDPLPTIKPNKDTSFALMLAAHKRGHSVFFLGNTNLYYANQGIQFRVNRVVPIDRSENPFEVFPEQHLGQDAVDVVFIRTDPPFDDRYLMNTWLLDRLPDRVKVVNNPTGVRTVNEKLWALQFTDLIPETTVTCKKAVYADFLAHHKTIIAKPTGGYGGSAVFKVQQGETNASVIFESLSAGETQEVILQPYIPEADIGDKRILLLNGEPLGAVLRVHAPGEHRNNFFAGGHPEPVGITPRDWEIIKTLKPKLLELGLYFVGIDVIGDYLIEVNVTSPTCIREMEAISGEDLAGRVVDALTI
ncbi:MAG: glutathione synthase [Candidatus Margulisiibacteriota bacterium]